MGGVWVKFYWNNLLVEKEDFILGMADFYCITNSDIRLLVVNCDWIICNIVFLLRDVLLEQLVALSIRDSCSLPLSLSFSFLHRYPSQHPFIHLGEREKMTQLDIIQFQFNSVQSTYTHGYTNSSGRYNIKLQDNLSTSKCENI